MLIDYIMMFLSGAALVFWLWAYSEARKAARAQQIIDRVKGDDRNE